MGAKLNGNFFDEKLMAVFLERVQENNVIDKESLGKNFIPFLVDGNLVGYLQSSFAEDIANEFNQVFSLSYGKSMSKVLIFTHDVERLSPDLRTEVVARVTRALSERGVIKGWREEVQFYPIIHMYY
jgi:hypothetical protein